MFSSQGVAWSYQLPGQSQEISVAAALTNPTRWHLAGWGILRPRKGAGALPVSPRLSLGPWTQRAWWGVAPFRTREQAGSLSSGTGPSGL